MTQRWSYPHSVGRTQYQHTVTLDGDTVTSDHPERLPNPRVTDVRAVFEQGAFFEASDPKVRFELMAAIAERLSPSDFTRTLDHRRLAYWRAYDPARVKRERFAYVRLRSDHSVERVCDWLVDAHGVFTTSPYGGGIEHHLPDEVYLCGPPTAHAPAWHRAHLRARLCGAQKREGALSINEGFRSICYRSIPKRDWSWGQNDSGESFAATEPGAVTVGYQYQHDYGTTSYVPERVLTEPWSTRISLGWPEDVGAQVRAALVEAGEEPSLVLDASVSECAEAFATLGPKLDWHASWPHTIGLQFEGFEPIRSEQQWQQSAAFGLFASLCPDKRLSHSCDSNRAGVRSLYQRSADDLWLSTDGAAVLRADYCFGTWSGGIDERWHVMPSPDRRAIFSIGTDYSQSDLIVVLGADTAEALSDLRAHCEAYFRALGLGACVASSLVRK